MKINFAGTIIVILCALFISFQAGAQDYPFQNTALPDDERLDNLISLMTLEEKIDIMSPRLPGIPRLGVNGTRIVEGLHGLALSGPANWAVRGKGAAPTTTFPQAIGLAQTWDPELHEQLAEWEAYEIRYLAQNPDYKFRFDHPGTQCGPGQGHPLGTYRRVLRRGCLPGICHDSSLR